MRSSERHLWAPKSAPALFLALAILGGCGLPAEELALQEALFFDDAPQPAEELPPEEPDAESGDSGSPPEPVVIGGPMSRSTLLQGCTLLDGDYWEADDEYGCDFASGPEFVCDDDGQCAPARMISLENVMERLRLLELLEGPSRLDAREAALFNNGDGPIMSVPGEVINIPPVDTCTSMGNVFVEVGGEVQCECDIGFMQVGTEQNGDPMCSLDWAGGDGLPPVPVPTPPPPIPDPIPDPEPEPACPEAELLRHLQRAAEDYEHCVYGAIDALQLNLQMLVVATGGAYLSGGTTAVLGAADAVGAGAMIAGYKDSVAACERSFCTTIRRVLEDCNIPIPEEAPDDLCDAHW